MKHSMRDRLEIVTAILLGLVSVASAFGAYQATVWSMQAAELSSVSLELRNRNLTSALTSQLILKDDGAKVIEALSLGAEAAVHPEQAAQLLAERDRVIASASPEVGVAWQAWVESGFAVELAPLQNPEYEATLFAEPHSMRDVSFVVEDSAKHLRAKSELITVAAVIFAISLFLLGIAGVNSATRVAFWLVAGGFVAFLVGSVVTVSAVV